MKKQWYQYQKRDERIKQYLKEMIKQSGKKWTTSSEFKKGYLSCAKSILYIFFNGKEPRF